MAVLLALASAVSFGISDVSGGLAAKRASAITVTLVAQLAGLVVLLPALVILPGDPSVRALALGALAGVGGSAGLILYLRGMAIGPMGVVSPLAALVGAAVPVGWGVALAGEVLAPLDVVGIVAGLAAVVLVAVRPRELREVHTASTLLSLLSGAAFGGFFVALDATPVTSGLWPLLGARIAGAVLLTAVLVVARRRMPDRRAARLVVLSGITDMSANVLFLLATRTGALSLTALLTSLYPVAVVLLARRLLDERLTRLQAGGVVLALAASALIAL
ncbi:MAG: DMT family transporter [Nitriliruptor sp.]